MAGLCNFAEVDFDIESDGSDPFFALMDMGIDGPPSITLPILLYSRENMRALYNYRSRITTRNSLQQFTGVAIVHAGKGARTLTLPTGIDQALQGYSAVLVNLSIEQHEFSTDVYRATATWVILSDPMP